MSDFLVHIGKEYNAAQLLALLKQLYGRFARGGQGFDFTWGSVAVLEELPARGENILCKDSVLCAWVGELALPDPGKRMEGVRASVARSDLSSGQILAILRSQSFLQELSGGFAVVLAHPQGVLFITDLRNFVPVYCGEDRNPAVRAFGTHVDLVAVLVHGQDRVSPVSVGEFLSFETISFPNTAYENVKRLDPASVCQVRRRGAERIDTQVDPYWQPPEELSRYEETKLARELRSALVEAVHDRCKGGRIAVQLSGGLDSRLIMALMPASVDCVGLTFCDEPNRETETAKKIAKCLGRPWVLLVRDSEYLAGIVEPATRFIACEGDFIHAHAMGLIDEIGHLGVDCIFDGVKIDTYLKGFWAHDMVRVARWGGLLPPRYVMRPYHHADIRDSAWQRALATRLVEGMRERRERFFARYGDRKRESLAEWCRLYPEDSSIAEWNVERRVLPKRLVALDRRVVQFAFTCPVHLKLGAGIFEKAATDLYGRARVIPNSNNGVRPGSRHWSRLVQRAVRKSQERLAVTLRKPGRGAKLEHSWHDYQKYWRESRKLDELRERHGKNLDPFDGILFRGSGRVLLADKTLAWTYGFRVLQLAVWRSLVREYRCPPERLQEPKYEMVTLDGKT